MKFNHHGSSPESYRGQPLIRSLFLCLIASLFLLTSFEGYSQTLGKLSGVITDSASHAVLPFVNVTLEGTRIGTSSNLSGSYSIGRISEGIHTITASAVGYARISREVDIKGGKMTTLDLEMVETPVTSPEVTITGNVDQPVSAASSQTLRAIDFELRPRLSAQDMLKMVPGLFIAQHAGGGKAEQIFLRGFDCDHGTDVNISVDGIPVNMVSHGHGQGFADLHFVMPEVLRGLEVYKGPYFVQSGDLGTAGTVKFNTLDALDHSSLNLESGSYGLVRLVGLGEIPIQSDASSAYVAGELLHNDSYFDNKQDFKRFNLFGKFTTALDANKSISIWASGFGSSWNASGQIPERAVAEGLIDRYGSIDPSEGGNTYRHNLNVIYTNADASGRFLVQGFASKYNFQLFSNFTFYKLDPIHGDEIEQDDNRVMTGGRAEYQLNETFGNPNINTLLGGSLRTDFITNQLWHVEKRVRLENRANADIRETSVGAYAQQEYHLAQNTRLQLGVRDDYFVFDLRDRLNAGTLNDITGIVTQNIVSPKANLIYSPSTTVDIYFNSGSGFHSNDARGVLSTRSETTLPRAIAAEVGTRYTPSIRFTTSVAFWGLDLDKEFTYNGDDGTVSESGPTRRIGIDIDARAQLFSWLWGDFDMTVSHGRFKDLPDGQNEIPLAPTLTSTGGLTIRFESGLEGSLRYRHMSERPANEDNTVTAYGYTVFDAGIAYRLDGFKLSIIADNLFNVLWNEAQFETESQIKGEAHPVDELNFTPGTPLTIRTKIEVSL